MKRIEVKIGSVYWCKIGSDMWKVTVLSVAAGLDAGKYYVAKLGSDQPLPMPRSAAKLHAIE